MISLRIFVDFWENSKISKFYRMHIMCKNRYTIHKIFIVRRTSLIMKEIRLSKHVSSLIVIDRSLCSKIIFRMS